MQTDSRFSLLFRKYVAGLETEEELQEFFAMTQNEAHLQELAALVDAEMSKAPIAAELSATEQEEILHAIHEKAKPLLQAAQARKIRLWPLVATAAAVAAVVFGLWFFNTPRSTSPDAETLLTSQDVAPGKQGATLTLANGKKIRLSDARNGELAKEAGVTVTKSEHGQLIYEIASSTNSSGTEENKMNTLSTTNGETYQVRLPDGSLVYLNAASSLTYSANLIMSRKRRVRLEGEGYFEVAKDKRHPFVVESRGQEVEVLGTHFNINAYADEPAVSTTLLEGSVAVRAGENRQLLKPGFQAINNGTKIKVAAADVEGAVDWKNNEFILDNQTLRTSLKKIARWYDVELVYEGGVLLDVETGGGIPRNSKLSSVLKLIESSGLAHFRLEGRKLYVRK